MSCQVYSSKILTNKIRLDCGTVLRSGRFLTHRRVSCWNSLLRPELMFQALQGCHWSPDSAAFLSSYVGCDSVASHAVGDAIDAGLEVQPFFRGKLCGHSRIVQSPLVFLLQINNCRKKVWLLVFFCPSFLNLAFRICNPLRWIHYTL